MRSGLEEDFPHAPVGKGIPPKIIFLSLLKFQFVNKLVDSR